MDRRVLIALYRVFFGGLTIAAIAAQLIDINTRGHLDLLNYFSYFTIDSNLIAVAVLFAAAVAIRRDAPTPRLDFLRGAVVVYMSVVGIVFSLLLSNTDVDTALPWVNFVVHELMPIVIVLDWLIDPPVSQLTFRQGLTWLAFPAVWLVYTLIKGPIVGKYPYPFLDPANGGYGSVAGYCVAILVGMTLFCVIVVAVGDWLRRRRVTA